MIRRIIDVITTLIVILTVLIALPMLGAKYLGAGSYVVQSGSMEPEYHTGSLIIDREVDVRELKEGDVITFSIAEDLTATHRIVKVIYADDAKADPGGSSDTDGSSGKDGASLRFMTKGDANDEADAQLVDPRNIIGTPIFQIPYLGYIINFVKRPVGMVVAGLLILLVFLSEAVKKRS